ncbi:DUF6199 family natural product biosynthesis protein [Paenibacillus macerans]|uniref:DUF6199 family natural product biosynthesis protein n=1 Tax=Paenibacillus macerans TaxID=44252 RepID=UPI003D319304
MLEFLLICIALLFLGLGGLVRKKPDIWWRMDAAWKVKGDSEPSAAYLDSMRFRGMCSIIVGCYLLVWAALILFL